MCINHCIKWVPSRNSCFGHDSFATSSQTTGNFNHYRIDPFFAFLIIFGFELTVTHSILNSNGTANSFGVLDKVGVLWVMWINHFLKSIHHGPIGIDLVIQPYISHLNTAGSGRTRDQVQCKLFTSKEFFKQSILNLSSIRPDTSHNLCRMLDCFLLVVTNEDVHCAHAAWRLDDNRILQFQLRNSINYICTISLSQTCILSHSQARIGHSQLHQPLVTTGRRKSQVIHNSETKQSPENITEIDGCLTARDHAQEPQVLLRFNRL
mmetsp:Transcript_29187/g.52866  ORF Transcript_29187/g.52866 Transcript_29187/m.52866 type:complete len:265 (-) Transcript_29187:830-1624(-)